MKTWTKSIVLLATAGTDVAAFGSPFVRIPTDTTGRNLYQSRRRTSALQATLDWGGPLSTFDEFCRSQPFISAFLACSVKASAADLLAQTSEIEESEIGESTESTTEESPALAFRESDTEMHGLLEEEQSVNVNRNLAFLLYGGLYQGMFLQFLYLFVYPGLYGDAGVFRVPLTICTDIFLFGPFITLPIAYVIRAFIEREDVESSFPTTMQDGIRKYKDHVVTQELLMKYWSIWAPAQTFNFTMVPEHLRVLFVALVSFFWVYWLSGISSQQTAKAGTS